MFFFQFDFWNEPRIGTPVEVLVSPKSLARLLSFLRKHDFEFSTVVEDLEK